MNDTSNKNNNSKEQNPLLEDWDSPFKTPPFDLIKGKHFLPAIKIAIQEQNKIIKSIIESNQEAEFENTISALEYSDIDLSRILGVFYNLLGSDTNKELQTIAPEISALLSKHFDSIYMNPKLFLRIEHIYKNKESLSLNSEEKMLLALKYKMFLKNGAKLKKKDKALLMQINERISLLSLSFEDNILAETNNYQLIIEDPEKLSGLPASAIEAASQRARDKNLDGKWIFTLHNSSLSSFLQYSDNRELRKEIFEAYINRCNKDNKYDNKAIALEKINLRLKRARLLGYNSHADLILEDNMAKSSKNVLNLLSELWQAAINRANTEAKMYRDLMRAEGINDKLEPYDWKYYTEKIKKTKYKLDNESLRPYFKLENMRDAVFDVAGKLFNIQIAKINNIPIYHPEVESYEIKNENNETIAIVYMDYFPRESKHAGAWMNTYREGYKINGEKIIPIITLNFNFTKATETSPSLLTFDEVETLYHEFGHALHAILSECTFPSISGTNVPRDFVEFPSQLMENWASQNTLMKKHALHYITKEAIPDELLMKMLSLGHFNQGFATVEYLAASFLDLYFHSITEETKDNIINIEEKVLSSLGLISEILPRYRSTYFSHIFAGGYDSAYYSYIWSEVLDADAFEAFKEKGIFDKETAESLKKEVFAMGHKEDPMKMYINFRGRKPKIHALLEKRGLNTGLSLDV